MARDFMGLNPKDVSDVLKEKIHDQAAFSKVLQWPFSKKVSVPPHSMTPKVTQEGWWKRIETDPHPPSSGFMTMPAAGVFDLSQKSSVAGIEKTFNLDQQGGTHVSVAAYNNKVQHDGRRSQHDLKMLSPSSNQRRVAASTCHIATAAQNQALGSCTKQQLPASTPAVGQGSIFPAISKWNSFKSEIPPAQLTIFYAGSVVVFDGISPDKAQALMLFAANGSSATANKEQSIAQAHAPNSKETATDAVLCSQNVGTPPSSARSSPISVSSHPAPQPGDGSTCSDELTGPKSAGVSTAPLNRQELSNAVVSMGPVAAKPMMPSAVPQFRKASLARFLEKRKERAMNMAPYNLGMKAQHSSTPEHKSDGVVVLSTAAAGAGSV